MARDKAQREHGDQHTGLPESVDSGWTRLLLWADLLPLSPLPGPAEWPLWRFPDSVGAPGGCEPSRGAGLCEGNQGAAGVSPKSWTSSAVRERPPALKQHSTADVTVRQQQLGAPALRPGVRKLRAGSCAAVPDSAGPGGHKRGVGLGVPAE